METRARRVGNENATYANKTDLAVQAKDRKRPALQTVTNVAAHSNAAAARKAALTSLGASTATTGANGASTGPLPGQLKRKIPAGRYFSVDEQPPVSEHPSRAPAVPGQAMPMRPPSGPSASASASSSVSAAVSGRSHSVMVMEDPSTQEDVEELSPLPASDDTIEMGSPDGDESQMTLDDDEEHLDHDHSHILDEDDEEVVAAAVSVTNPHALSVVHTAASARELADAARIVQTIPGMLDEDDEDMYDVSMVAEYAGDIFHYLQKLETQLLPSAAYMDQQREIQWNMRAILVDWLVQVHYRFSLLPETLFLTINFIDRFLTIKTVSLNKLQLVGAVGLFLAAKYEEINCPGVNEIAYMVDHGYTVDEILKAERYMIDVLDFNLGYPGPMSFLRRTSKADDYDLETRTLAKYLLEITIMDQRFVGTQPSWTAACAHYLSRYMLQKGPWTPAHVYFSGYTEEQLLPGIDVLKECCQNPVEHHKAIYEKYSDKKFKKAALFVAEWIRHV